MDSAIAVGKAATEEKEASGASAGTNSPSKAGGGESTLKNGPVKAAPPVPAFKAPPKQNAKDDAATGIDSLFSYKPIFQMPPFYLK